MNRFTIAQPVYGLLINLLRCLEAKQHETGLVDVPAAFESGQGARFFAFVTLSPETAERARKALEAAGCLPGEEVHG